MKKMILILAAVAATFEAARAQDTIRYPDSCYMYNPLVIDSVHGQSVGSAFATAWSDFTVVFAEGNSAFYDSAYCASHGYEYMLDSLTGKYMWVLPCNHPTAGIYREYVAQGQTFIYGIAATTGGYDYINSGQEMDSIYTRWELLNINQLTDTSVNNLYAYLLGKSNGETYCIDSVKWIRHNNPYRYFIYKSSPNPFFDTQCVTYSYEFYFNKPVPVADTFIIGLRFPIRTASAYYSLWNFRVTYSNTMAISELYYGDYSDTIPIRERDHCKDLLRVSTYEWGGLFPILTPRDTTRCDPVREVSVFTATDTSVTLQWRANNATQWEVEYAEADGMTAYTVTTTTPRTTLTGLRPSTTYLAHVRAWCARDSEYGEWSSFVEMRTTAPQPPDTTQPPDSVKIDAVGLFTRLMPNPANSLVTVQSAYSLSRMAVYDVQGRLVIEQKAAGNVATFNVGTLPKGVYMVSVSTIAGTTTKRLLVE